MLTDNNKQHLQDLCDKGVNARTDHTLKFDLFNKEERDFVHEYMNVKYSHVPFFCTWLDFSKADR